MDGTAKPGNDRFHTAYAALQTWAEGHGIAVALDTMAPDVPGRFDGPSITMNRAYSAEDRSYYLAHAIGSIVGWSLDPPLCESLFRTLDAAKNDRGDCHRLGAAIAGYRDYETIASEYAVWLLDTLGFGDIVPAYTNFWRADLESMTLLHVDGKAPVWRDFFAAWNRKVAHGDQPVSPYKPRPIPPFQPVPMRPQEIVQED